MPLMLQAIRALLRFLVAAELSSKLQLQVLPLLPSSQAASQQQAEVKAQQVQRERGWRVTCAELLAAVLADVAELKVRVWVWQTVCTNCACPALKMTACVLADAWHYSFHPQSSSHNATAGLAT